MQDILNTLIAGKSKIDIVCFGSPAIPGDALGPLVGTCLKHVQNKDILIIGTLDNPIISSNLDKRLEEIRKDSFVIAIDAALLNYTDVCHIEVANGYIQPGSAVSNNNYRVGHMFIKARFVRSIHELVSTDPIKVFGLATDIAAALRTALITV